jgi:hypothetical protein
MPIPKSVKIGTQVWEIIEQKRKHSVSNNHFGFTSTGNNSIVLDFEQAPSMKRVTLFHELLHAIRITFGGSFQPGKNTDFDDWEHFFIGLYEEPVVLMLRDNPELADYLLGGND